MPTIINPYRFNTLTFTFVDSAEATSDPTITIPTVLDNDIAIIVDRSASSGSPPPENVPSGWTKLFGDTETVGSTAQRITVYWRTLTAGLSGTTVAGTGSVNDMMMLVFRPSRAVASATAGDGDSEHTSGNPASQTVTASSGTPPLIVIGWCRDGDGTLDAAFSTATPAFDDEVEMSDGQCRIGYKIYHSSPQDHTVDMADLGGFNTLVTLYVQFT